jgi:alpha-N-arabinofuranosidase
VTAEDPAGEWSEPVRIAGEGFDPDLFFDDDGRAYFSRHAGDHLGIRLWEIDLRSGRLVGAEHRIWPGFEDDLCEAPHVYRHGNRYYLLAAEGGTHRGHMVVCGRAERPEGPYEPCPHNPILTHRARVSEAVQATGHADLVQAHDGTWWLVCLGIRQNGWRWHHLGRETFLVPVTWTAEGWPAVNRGEPVRETGTQSPGLPSCPWPASPVRDDFDDHRLGFAWSFRRNPLPGSWSLEERAGWLSLHGSEHGLDDGAAPTFVGRRQEHFVCSASSRLDFDPSRDGEEAGLTVFLTERHHYEVALGVRDGGRVLRVRKRIGDVAVIDAEEPAPPDPVTLWIQATRDVYSFAWSSEGGTAHELGRGLARYVSSEVAGGFTGVYFAMYATGSGRPSLAPARFDWFDYCPGVE